MSDTTIPELPSKKVPYGACSLTCLTTCIVGLTCWRNADAYSIPRQVRPEGVQGHPRVHDLRRRRVDGLAVAPRRGGRGPAHQVRVRLRPFPPSPRPPLSVPVEMLTGTRGQVRVRDPDVRHRAGLLERALGGYPRQGDQAARPPARRDRRHDQGPCCHYSFWSSSRGCKG